jgi:hypothetical protein
MFELLPLYIRSAAAVPPHIFGSATQAAATGLERVLITSRLSRATSCACAALVWMTIAAATARAGSAPHNDTAGFDPPLDVTNDNSGGIQVASYGENTAIGPDLPADTTLDNNGGVQVAFAGARGGQLIQPPPVATGRPNLFEPPGRGDEGLPIGNWLVFPSTTAGVVFATNPNNSPTGGRASPGLMLRSNTFAQTDDGIRKTILYSISDAQFYLNQGGNSGSSLNNINSHTGLIEAYRPISDLMITAQADFTRQMDYFSSLGVTNNLSTLNPTGVGVAPSSNSLPYNQLSGSASVQTNFLNAFAIVSGSIVDLTYDRSSTITATSPNGVTFTGTGRLGLWVVPDLYTYLETRIDKRDYATAALSSSGFRSVAGLGSDQMGLFRGELYAGYQAENYTSAAVGSTAGPVFGGTGSYFPLPELTMSASVDQSIGASSLAASPTSPVGTSTKVATLLGQTRYAFAPEWSVVGRGGLALTTYGGSNRRDTAWTVGMSVLYSVWQNFGLNLDIQRTALTSTVPQAGSTNNVVSLSLSYVY